MGPHNYEKREINLGEESQSSGMFFIFHNLFTRALWGSHGSVLVSVLQAPYKQVFSFQSAVIPLTTQITLFTSQDLTTEFFAHAYRKSVLRVTIWNSGMKPGACYSPLSHKWEFLIFSHVTHTYTIYCHTIYFLQEWLNFILIQLFPCPSPISYLS